MSAGGAGARRLFVSCRFFPFFFNRLARRFSGAPPGVVEASMSELRAIDVSDYAPLKPPEQAGAAPQLMWLKIATLGVPILLRGNGYLIELPAKARLRGLIARARGVAVSA